MEDYRKFKISLNLHYYLICIYYFIFIKHANLEIANKRKRFFLKEFSRERILFYREKRVWSKVLYLKKKKKKINTCVGILGIVGSFIVDILISFMYGIAFYDVGITWTVELTSVKWYKHCEQFSYIYGDTVDTLIL